MRKQLSKFQSVLLLSILFFSVCKLNAQSSSYPYFMKYYWSESYDSETKSVLANRLINNTSRGENYVKRLNSLYREFENVMDEKKSAERENDNYSSRRNQYEKQYNSANAMLQMVKVNYSMCRSNCNSIAQNANNIINNMNNLASKMEDANRGLSRTYNLAEDLSRRLKEIDREQHNIKMELNDYFQENISNGNISMKIE